MLSGGVVGEAFWVNLAGGPLTLFTVAFMDRLGRKPLFVAGAFLSALSVGETFHT